MATRFSLPVRALAYSPSGTNLAAGGDDEGIKLLSAAESKVHRLDCTLLMHAQIKIVASIACLLLVTCGRWLTEPALLPCIARALT